MTKVTVEVTGDHLDRIAQRTTPLRAVAEMVWNAVDGDATSVQLFVDENGLGGVDTVRVVDNGSGIRHERALASFKALGDSWKKGRVSGRGRRYHGENGEGRFTSFAIGSHVRWSTCWKEGTKFFEFRIVGKRDEPGVGWRGASATATPLHLGLRAMEDPIGGLAAECGGQTRRA